MLAMQKERHDNEPSAPYLSAFSMNYLFKQLKREYPWLKDADSTALTGTPENLHKAYTRFFKGQTRFPKFKSKKHEQSYISKCVNNNIVIITSAFQSRVPYTSNVIEDLKAKGMMHNHHLSRAVANVSWNMFANMLAYKCLSYGKKLIRVNPKYTSQTCNVCGSVNNRMGYNAYG